MSEWGCEDDEDGHISRVEEMPAPSLPPHGQRYQIAEPLEEVGRELGQGVCAEVPVPAFHPDRQIASQSQRCKRVAHREIMRHRRTSRQEGRQAVASGRVRERVIGGCEDDEDGHISRVEEKPAPSLPASPRTGIPNC